MSEQQNTQNKFQKQATTPKKTKKNSNKSILIIGAIFIAFVIMVFIKQETTSVEVNWIKDYSLGLQEARTQNKPILLVFYKYPIGGKFTKDMFENTFQNEDTIQFIHENFIPILINVYENKQLAERFKYGYEPTCLVVSAEDENVIKSRVGYDPPSVFREEMTAALKELVSH